MRCKIMKVTENDIKRILTKEVMDKLIEMAQFHVKYYGGDYGVVLRDLAVEWVAHEIKNN
ncbi:MAG: hypothetical protein J6R59_01920 [Paludibacteraceae bacterium]|nr:hypothetical protein [Paludibacteraceae bacterium]